MSLIADYFRAEARSCFHSQLGKGRNARSLTRAAGSCPMAKTSSEQENPEVDEALLEIEMPATSISEMQLLELLNDATYMYERGQMGARMGCLGGGVIM